MTDDEHRATAPSVLLVDDRPENLLALKAVLAGLDVRLVSAGSGEEALRALLDEDFAVVLLDVQMPGMDGFETARYIRGRERSARTPIIFLTAISTDLAHVLRGYEAGAVDYVLKPFEPVVLRSKVEVFADLERFRHEREGARARAAAERAARAEAEALAGRLARVAALTDGLDAFAVDDVVGELCRRLHDVLGARAAAVRVLDTSGGVVAEAQQGNAEAAAPALDRALATGRTVTDHSAQALGVPLRAGGQLFGAVAVAGVDAGTPEAQRDALVVHAAERAALSIRRALMLEHERHVASTLQRELLPHTLPELPGVSLCAHFSPGGHGIEIGGDWYDAIPLSGGRLGLVIGDVAGRGVAAASRMGQLRSVAHAYALEGHEPAALALRLNVYHRALRPEDLTTLIYAVIEPDRERLRFINAGHPPPLLVVPGEPPRLLEGCSPPLGVSDLPAPDEIVVDFPPGAALVLYTDGLVERRDEGIQVGLGRLMAGARKPVNSLVALRDEVLAACLGTADGDDDVTALFVRAEPVLGPSARFTLSPDGEALLALRRMLRRWLTEAGASSEDVAAVTMAANEAWENAIEHAHSFAPIPITVTFEHRDDDVFITVDDAGAAPGDPDPDRGRGLALMRALMDDATFNFGANHGGSVVLRRRLGADRGADAARPVQTAAP